MMLYAQIHLTLPAWIHERVDTDRSYPGDEAKVALAVELSRLNVEAASGGPFGAAVFDANDRIIAVARNPEGSLVDLDEPTEGDVSAAGDGTDVPAVVLEADTVTEDGTVVTEGPIESGGLVESADGTAETGSTSDQDASKD